MGLSSHPAEKVTIEIIETIERLMDVLREHRRIAIYFYDQDWPRLNERLGVDVCDAFASRRECVTQETAFFEADLPKLRASDPDFPSIAASLNIPDEPCVVVFLDGRRIIEYRGRELVRLRTLTL